MRIFDPIRHCRIPLDDCEQLPAVGAWTPVRPYGREAWFAMHSATGETARSIPEVDRAVAVHEASEAILEACRMLVLAPTPPHARNYARARFGLTAVTVAEARARLAGFDPNYGWGVFRILELESAREPTNNVMESDDTSDDVVVRGSHRLKAVFVDGRGLAEMFANTGLKSLDWVKLDRFAFAAKQSSGDPDPSMRPRVRTMRGASLYEYAKQRRGVLIDCTGQDYASVCCAFRRLRAVGYDCRMVRNETHVALRKLFGPRKFFEVTTSGTVGGFSRHVLGAPVTNPAATRWIKYASQPKPVKKKKRKPRRTPAPGKPPGGPLPAIARMFGGSL